MRQSREPGRELGRVLTVVGPHPVSVLIGCIPGLVMCLVVASNIGRGGLALLLHPEVELPAGVRPFMWGSLIVALLILGVGLRHIFDRAELCRDGMRILGKSYEFERMGPISWSRRSQSGFTRFWDQTVARFRYDGKEVQVRTRYLQDLSYQYYKTYGTEGAQVGPNLKRAQNTEIEH